ncbi:hypothetical protein ABFX02_03G051900 [Erythranthe guttata]
MGSKININIITQLTILVLSANILEACFFTTEFTVQIIADPSLGAKLPLTIHCSSGNEDLGIHKLYGDYTAHGYRSFGWKFCENLIGNSVYTCDFHWHKKKIRFQVFNSAFSDKACQYESTCTWYVHTDAFHLNLDWTNVMYRW